MQTLEISKIISIVLKALAVGMGITSIVLGFIPNASDINTHMTLLSIGLAAIAIATLMKEE